MRAVLVTVLVAAAGVMPAAALAQPLSSSRSADGCQTRECVWRVTVRPYRAWLARLRQCETRDTNARGYHRGFYQFTWQTWRLAGGVGDPADASKLEQGYRAVKWRKRIGNPKQTAGWPVCG